MLLTLSTRRRAKNRAAMYKLFLFVTADIADDAKARLAHLLRGLARATYALETIDVDKEPLKAQQYKITETPMVLILRENAIARTLSLNDDYEIRYALGLTRLW